MNGWWMVVGGALLVGCVDPGDNLEPAPQLIADELATPVAPLRYDFSCRGQQPRRAADPVQLDAFIYDSYAIGPLGDAVVDLIAVDGDVILERAISDHTGALSFEVATNGAPLDHYTRMEREGHITSYVYPSAPLTQDELNRALPLLPPTWRAELAGYAGVTLDPATGIVEVIVTDCAGARVEGAHVAFDPPGATVAYWDVTFTDASATRTTINGHAWAFNVPAGQVTATVTYGDVTWRERPVQSFADSRTLTWRAP